jgi:hypothetical protein
MATRARADTDKEELAKVIFENWPQKFKYDLTMKMDKAAILKYKTMVVKLYELDSKMTWTKTKMKAAMTIVADKRKEKHASMKDPDEKRKFIEKNHNMMKTMCLHFGREVSRKRKWALSIIGINPIPKSDGEDSARPEGWSEEEEEEEKEEEDDQEEEDKDLNVADWVVEWNPELKNASRKVRVDGKWTPKEFTNDLRSEGDDLPVKAFWTDGFSAPIEQVYGRDLKSLTDANDAYGKSSAGKVCINVWTGKKGDKELRITPRADRGKIYILLEDNKQICQVKVAHFETEAAAIELLKDLAMEYSDDKIDMTQLYPRRDELSKLKMKIDAKTRAGAKAKPKAVRKKPSALAASSSRAAEIGTEEEKEPIMKKPAAATVETDVDDQATQDTEQEEELPKTPPTKKPKPPIKAKATMDMPPGMWIEIHG